MINLKKLEICPTQEGSKQNKLYKHAVKKDCLIPTSNICYKDNTKVFCNPQFIYYYN